MSRLAWFTLLLLPALLFTASGFAGTPQIERVPLDWEHASVEDGAILYAELCAACHGAVGAGDGPAAPALESELSDLRTLTTRHDGTFPERWLDRIIRGENIFPSHGAREMPIWGHAFYDVRPDWKRGQRADFVDRKIEVLIAHLRTLQVEVAPAPEETDSLGD